MENCQQVRPPVAPAVDDHRLLHAPCRKQQATRNLGGLKNGPVTLQCLMHWVMGDVPQCSVHLDDVVIYSDTWLDHVTRLKTVLNGLLKLAWLFILISVNSGNYGCLPGWTGGQWAGPLGGLQSYNDLEQSSYPPGKNCAVAWSGLVNTSVFVKTSWDLLPLTKTSYHPVKSQGPLCVDCCVSANQVSSLVFLAQSGGWWTFLYLCSYNQRVRSSSALLLLSLFNTIPVSVVPSIRFFRFLSWVRVRVRVLP